MSVVKSLDSQLFFDITGLDLGNWHIEPGLHSWPSASSIKNYEENLLVFANDYYAYASAA